MDSSILFRTLFLLMVISSSYATAAQVRRGDEVTVATTSVNNPGHTTPHSVPAEITTPPRDLTILAGHSAIFECHVRGAPFPEVVWIAGGVPVMFNRGRYSVKRLVSGVVLKISAVDKDTDDGLIVRCMADNGLGPTDVAEAELTVVHTDIPSGFPTHSPEQPKLVAFGETVELRCPIGGQPPLVFRWYKDLTPLTFGLSFIHIDHNGGITIHNASVADSGNYICSAGNEHGTAFSEGTSIFVGIKPRITYSPRDHKTRNGSHVTFFCQSAGLPRPRLFWKANGVRVTEESHPMYTVHKTDNSTSLSIGRALYARDHRVEFECFARNDLGNDEASARLEVYKDDDVPDCYPRLTSTPKFRSLQPGDSVTFTCPAEGRPTPDITWVRGWTPINSGNPRYLFTETGSLHISPVRPEDSEFYVCVAENSVGVTYSEPAYFYVRESGAAPRIVSLTEDTVKLAPEGSTKLTCVATGDPMPYVTWSTGGSRVTDPLKIPVGMATVNVQPAPGVQEYVCEAYSLSGNTSKVVTVLPAEYSSTTVWVK